LKSSFNAVERQEKKTMQPDNSLPESWQELASRIDYSCLQVDARACDIRLACLEAQKYALPTVVVNPVNITMATQVCRGSSVGVVGAVAYPVGGDRPDFKALEVQEALAEGAEGIYMLMAVGAFREGWLDEQTRPEIAGLVKAAAGLKTTLITEGSVLTTAQIRELVHLAIEAGVCNMAVCSGFDRSRLPEISDQTIQEFADAAGGSLGLVYMGRVSDLDQAGRLIGLGVNRLCTPDARMLLQGYSSFPFT
jgi:deoxyribose-phosphate aldolase